MNTSLSHLPERKQEQLREITETIVGAVDPEKVILFGSHATGRWVEDRFTEGHITYEYVSGYDLLVIAKADEKRKDYEIQDIVESHCRYKTPVNAITHNIGYINKHLSEGQYFFSDIEKEGIMLYDAVQRLQSFDNQTFGYSTGGKMTLASKQYFRNTFLFRQRGLVFAEWRIAEQSFKR
ncbi:MAG: nucleotidyltransferase domain-containing protein [Puia sp.]|nr:nucleotidyltransferase domain-containing protein [Puia sp.]